MKCHACGIDLAKIPTPCPWGFKIWGETWTALRWIKRGNVYTCGKCERGGRKAGTKAKGD